MDGGGGRPQRPVARRARVALRPAAGRVPGARRDRVRRRRADRAVARWPAGHPADVRGRAARQGHEGRPRGRQGARQGGARPAVRGAAQAGPAAAATGAAAGDRQAPAGTPSARGEAAREVRRQAHRYRGRPHHPDGARRGSRAGGHPVRSRRRRRRAGRAVHSAAGRRVRLPAGRGAAQPGGHGRRAAGAVRGGDPAAGRDRPVRSPRCRAAATGPAADRSRAGPGADRGARGVHPGRDGRDEADQDGCSGHRPAAGGRVHRQAAGQPDQGHGRRAAGPGPVPARRRRRAAVARPGGGAPGRPDARRRGPGRRHRGRHPRGAVAAGRVAGQRAAAGGRRPGGVHGRRGPALPGRGAAPGADRVDRVIRSRGQRARNLDHVSRARPGRTTGTRSSRSFSRCGSPVRWPAR